MDTIPDLNEEVQLHKTSVLIVQCSNGYEYATGGYDFNPILEQELVKKLRISSNTISIQNSYGSNLSRSLR
jgi:hypothetical protein